jgi:integral membrane protein
MTHLLKSTLGRLRVVAFLEGVSFIILLFIAMPLKYMAGKPQAVSQVGMAHGVLFVLYVFYLAQVKAELDWTWKKTALAFLASLVPFGTFWADKKLFQ